MKQFGRILSFELKSFLKNKIFVGVTVFLVAVIAIIMFFPRIENAFSQEDIPVDNTEASTLLLKAPSEELSRMAAELLGEAFAPDYVVQTTDSELNEIKNRITSGEVEGAFVLTSPTEYTYYVNNLSMYDMNTQIADQVLQSVYRMSAMLESGMSPEEASGVMAVTINSKAESLGVDQMENYWYTYIMIFALYMVIMLYGQMVATNVATEKSSRAMELLITSAKPESMMFGKVIASCIAGLIQLIAVFGSAILFYGINKSYWGDNEIIASIFDMPGELFAFLLIFFVLGFLIYAFMYGAIGSTASKLEDINTSVMPITLLFIAAFFVVFFSFASGEADNTVMKVCSYIPFTSSMAMFTRICMSNVPWYEIAISILILIGSSAGIGVIAAKIYRIGVLLYGTPPKISSILKALKKS